MTEATAQSCDKFNSFKIMAIQKTVWNWSYELQNIFLKMWKLFSFRRTWSPVTVEGKNEFLCFILNKSYALS